MVKVVFISIAIFLIAFLVLRGVMLWYWKINEILVKLDLILAELQKISRKKMVE